MSGPMEGVRVVELGFWVSGPSAGGILADWGADVVKIEPPDGDAYRNLYRAPGYGPSAYNYPWLVDNRSKRGLALDLRQPDGRAVLYRLVERADVFVTNLPLPARARWRLTWEDLAPLSPRLIYGSLTAYGETGDEAGRTGFDSTALWARRS
jgi:formyl-CoA transferase